MLLLGTSALFRRLKRLANGSSVRWRTWDLKWGNLSAFHCTPPCLLTSNRGYLSPHLQTNPMEPLEGRWLSQPTLLRPLWPLTVWCLWLTPASPNRRWILTTIAYCAYIHVHVYMCMINTLEIMSTCASDSHAHTHTHTQHTQHTHQNTHFYTCRFTTLGFVWSLFWFLPFPRPVLSREQVVLAELGLASASGFTQVWWQQLCSLYMCSAQSENLCNLEIALRILRILRLRKLCMHTIEES